MRYDIREFAERFCLHDSLLSGIENNGHEVILYVTLCRFMQDGYDDTESENENIAIVFGEVTDFDCPEDLQPDFDEFNSQKMTGNGWLEFYMLGSEYGRYFIRVKAGNAEIRR